MATKLKTVEDTGEPTTLASAMALAFAEIEGAKKDANNPHFNAKFASLGSVMDAVKPALAAHGLFFTQASHVVPDGVCVETVIHHASGETLSCGQLYVPANKKDAQGFGSALTYARRYSLMTAFGVPTEDDDGNAAVAATYSADPTIPGITKIRNNLNKLRRDGGKATDLDTFNALVTANKDDLQKIKDAEHTLWTGMGEDFDGFRAWIKQRREELTPPERSTSYQLLVSNVEECQNNGELSAFLARHSEAIEMLDGEESREFERIYDAKAQSLAPAKAPTPLETGLVGG